MNPSPLHDLRQRTVSGLGWSGAAQVAGLVLQFVFSVVLARLLSPSEFGLLGMVLVFTGFASSIADLGLGASIIQKRDLSAGHLDATFWLNVAVGGLLTIAFGLLAPLFAKFYSEPQVRLLTIAVAFNFFLGSLTTVQGALLSRSLSFRTQFWIDIVALAVSGIVAVALAWTGAGVWSLVGQAVSLTTMRVAMTWHLSSWRPAWSFDRSAAKELLGFGRHLVGSNAIIYWENNFDKLAIGHLIGSSALGIYNLAERLMRLPSTVFTRFTGAVMFPALSTLQDDVASVKRVYLRANRMIALVTFPMMMGLIVLAEPAILVVYGDQWQSAIPIVQLLCLAGMAQSVYNTAAWIYLSRGRPDILLRLAIFALVVRVVGVAIGMNWGIIGIVWAYLLGVYLGCLYPTWSIAGRLIDLRFGELLKNVAGPFCCAAGMAAAIWLSERYLLVERAHWLRLVVHVLAGATVYGLFIRSFRLRAWDDLREMILEMGGGRSRMVRWLVGNRSV